MAKSQGGTTAPPYTSLTAPLDTLHPKQITTASVHVIAISAITTIILRTLRGLYNQNSVNEQSKNKYITGRKLKKKKYIYMHTSHTTHTHTHYTPALSNGLRVRQEIYRNLPLRGIKSLKTCVDTPTADFLSITGLVCVVLQAVNALASMVARWVNYQLEGIWIEAIASFYTILSNTERISSR
jgi:hypothetical protein